MCNSNMLLLQHGCCTNMTLLPAYLICKYVYVHILVTANYSLCKIYEKLKNDQLNEQICQITP